MDPHKIIQELIDQPPEPNKKAIENEKEIKQKEIDLEVWLKNAFTKEVLNKLETEIESLKNILVNKTIQPDINDRDIRILTIHYATTINMYNSLTNVK